LLARSALSAYALSCRTLLAGIARFEALAAVRRVEVGVGAQGSARRRAHRTYALAGRALVARAIHPAVAAVVRAGVGVDTLASADGQSAWTAAAESMGAGYADWTGESAAATVLRVRDEVHAPVVGAVVESHGAGADTLLAGGALLALGEAVSAVGSIREDVGALEYRIRPAGLAELLSLDRANALTFGIARRARDATSAFRTGAHAPTAVRVTARIRCRARWRARHAVARRRIARGPQCHAADAIDASGAASVGEIALLADVVDAASGRASGRAARLRGEGAGRLELRHSPACLPGRAAGADVGAQLVAAVEHADVPRAHAAAGATSPA